jgi:hypothetical protein
MRKLLLIHLLVFAIFGVAQAQSSQASGQAPQPGQSAAGQAGDQSGAQPQQKTIKDPAEYNAYMSASSQTDPNAKAQALEAFLQQYPNSVVKEETLEQLMGAYQAGGNQAKMTDAANRLLQVDPNNIRALALLVYSKRLQAASTNNAQQAEQILAEGAQLAQRGLQSAQNMPKTPGMADADYQKLKSGVTTIFNGALGMEALQRKDYVNAQKYLLAAVQDPADANNLQDVYPLATAYLQAPDGRGRDYLNGLWYAARAVDLAAQNPQAQQQINQFALYYYKKYHGGEDGWQQVLQQAQSSPNPPQGFTIAQAPPPPTPCEFADQIMQKYNNDVSQMAYGDWLFILGSGNQRDADAVWNFLNGKLIPVTSKEHPGKVISSTANEIVLATTDDDIHENKADVTVRMATPLRQPPAAGSMLGQRLVGKATSYTPIHNQPTGTPQGAGADADTTGEQAFTSGQTGTAGQQPTANDQSTGAGQQQQPGAGAQQQAPAGQQQQPGAAAQEQPGAAGQQQQPGAMGAQQRPAGQQAAGGRCNSADGVMLVLTEGKLESAAPAKKAPARRTTTRRRTAAH